MRERGLHPKQGEQTVPTLLKLRVDSFATAGVDLAPFAVIPDEQEVVYPPCTYLEPRSEKEEQVSFNDEELTVKIIEVVPQVA